VPALPGIELLSELQTWHSVPPLVLRALPVPDEPNHVVGSPAAWCGQTEG
jgi:hypothetical protein